MVEVSSFSDRKSEVQESLHVLENKLKAKLISDEEYERSKAELTERLKRTDQHAVTIERTRMYATKPVRTILNLFLQGNVKTITPLRDPAVGCRYTVAEQVTGMDSKDTFDLLERMADVYILNRSFSDRQIFCPDCKSTGFSIRSFCPKCKSVHLTGGTVIEHLTCGHLDFEISFQRGVGTMICPKCGKPIRLVGVDYRKLDMTRCLDCGEYTTTPTMMVQCLTCGHEDNLDRIKHREFSSYSLNSSLRDEINQYVFSLLPIKDLCEKLGYTIISPAMLKGHSGTEHQFDLMIQSQTDKEPTVKFVADVAVSSDAVGVAPIISLFAKAIDTTLAQVLLLVMPRFTENAQRLAKTYNIQVAEGENIYMLLDSIKKLLPPPTEMRVDRERAKKVVEEVKESEFFRSLREQLGKDKTKDKKSDEK